MHSDDEMVGRWLTRRELVALFGASAVAATVHRIQGQVAAPVANAVPSCVVQPQQTEGPYFVDEKLLRSDVRSDPTNGVVKGGSPLDLKLRFVEVDAAGTCAALTGAQVDIWHCDAMGVYSDVRDPNFNTIGQKFLRGHQISDKAGEVRFTTIYPGWYPDRAVHIHFKVRTNPGASQGYEFVSQLYFDEQLNDRVHANPPYAAHSGRRMRNEEDPIYRGGGTQLMLPVTRQGNRYAGTFSVGMRAGGGTSGRTGRGGPGGRGRQGR